MTVNNRIVAREFGVLDQVLEHEDCSRPKPSELLALSTDKLAVLRTYEHRFFSGGGSGSFALRFVRRRPLVAAMATHDSDAVREWAAETSERLEANIVRWDEREAADDSLFE